MFMHLRIHPSRVPAPGRDDVNQCNLFCSVQKFLEDPIDFCSVSEGDVFQPEGEVVGSASIPYWSEEFSCEDPAFALLMREFLIQCEWPGTDDDLNEVIAAVRNSFPSLNDVAHGLVDVNDLDDEGEGWDDQFTTPLPG
jgi:hypothetical protein